MTSEIYSYGNYTVDIEIYLAVLYNLAPVW